METLSAVGIQLVQITRIILNVYTYVILAAAILPIFIPRESTIVQFLAFITDPVLEPIRKRLKPLMAKSSVPIDFSPMIAFFIIALISELLGAIF